MRELRAEIRVPTRCELGEGPRWDVERRRLLWLDIRGERLHSKDADGLHRDTALDRPTTFVAPTRSGGLIAAGGSTVRLTDAEGMSARLLAALPVEHGTRTNDGGVDPQGRLWIGTSDEERARGRGKLFRIDGQGNIHVLRHGLALSNGIGWSPDGRIAYHVDTFPRRIDRLTLDSQGDILNVDVFVETDAMPDGIAIDSNGGVWVALWDGGAVHRYDIEGKLDQIVHVDAGRVTSCTFGPPGSTELFITTARQGMTEAQLSDQPASGAVFSVDVGIEGRGTTTFNDRT